MHLSTAAFGLSTDMTENHEPRHYIYFEPGEVWFLNSALTAHQSVYGTRLVIGSFIHSYDEYKSESDILPNIIEDIRAQEEFFA
jgi:hypothetical protein